RCSSTPQSSALTPLRPPRATLFPYTTLFRSAGTKAADPAGTRPAAPGLVPVPSAPQCSAPRPPAPGEGQHVELCRPGPLGLFPRSEEHTSELQSRFDLVCRLLLEKKKHTAME